MYRKPTKRYFSALNALYGEQLDLADVAERQEERTTPAIRKPKNDCPTEQQEQFVAVAAIRKMGLVVHHSPNGGYRDAREGAKFKRLGTMAGFPDLCLPYARKSYHGLYIELKRVVGGKLSESQIWWRDFLIAEGYAWYEAKGAAECIKIVREYFNVE